MKMKFSHKDILLLVGIVVAVIITLTTLVFKDGNASKPKTTKNALQPNTSFFIPSSALKEVVERIDFGSRLFTRL